MTVKITHGSNSRQFTCVGKTVGDAKKRLKEVFNIPSDASAFLNGLEVDIDQLLSDGDNLEFVKVQGSKSSLHDFWSENEVEQLFGRENLDQMRAAGLELKMKPCLSTEEIIFWTGWSSNQEPTKADTCPINVDIDSETITVHGKFYQIDQQMAAVVQCLLEARGERRSCQDMRERYPLCIFDERLDITIKRKLKRHISGVGKYVISDKRGYRLISPDCVQ